MDQLPRLGKRELICLLLFTCNYVVFIWRSFLFLLVLGMDYVILLWHSLSLPYNYSGGDRPSYINEISFQFLYLSFQEIQYVWNIPFDNLERGLGYLPPHNMLLEMLHFICYRSPNPHNCCNVYPFPLLKTSFICSLLYLYNLPPPTPY